MVSLELFIDIILPAALWLWGRLSLLTEMSTSGIFWGVKAADATLPPSYADCLEIWQPHPPGSSRACRGQYKDCFTFFYLNICANTNMEASSFYTSGKTV